jgi:curli biogenesis system outer membrane secretion channel CsgG
MASLCVALLMFFVGSSVVAETTIPAPPAGNLRYSITVTKFKNEAGWQGQWSVGDGMKTSMTNLLHESGWFIVLGDDEMRQEAMKEQDFAASGRTAQGKKAAKIGRMTPAQLLVRGSITHVQNDTGGGGGGFSFQGISIGGSAGEAEMNITIYLVDSETGQVVASTDVIGKSGRKGFTVGYHGGALGGLGGDFGGHKNDNVGKAMEDAVGQAVVFLIDQLDAIPWEGSVVLVKGSEIVINRGSREGVEVGRQFKVGGVDELVDPDTGEVLDSEMTEVGTIKVTKTKEKISYCTAMTGSGIQKGMSVFPMDR